MEGSWLVVDDLAVGQNLANYWAQAHQRLLRGVQVGTGEYRGVQGSTGE